MNNFVELELHNMELEQRVKDLEKAIRQIEKKVQPRRLKKFNAEVARELWEIAYSVNPNFKD